jgi:hypothetical protein
LLDGTQKENQGDCERAEIIRQMYDERKSESAIAAFTRLTI